MRFRPGSLAGRAGVAAALLPLTAATAASAAESNRPMYYLETFGSPGHEIAAITWGLIWLSIGSSP